MESSLGPSMNAKRDKSILSRYINMFVRHKFIYFMVLPGLCYLLLFDYFPLYFLQIAFRSFNMFTGLADSPWVGLQNFLDLFQSTYFLQALKNTVIISFYNLFWGFPVPIMIAILLNELRNVAFGRTIQSLLYLPHFLSWVIIGGLVAMILSPEGGIVNIMLGKFGVDPIFFMADKRWFRSVLVASSIWKEMGWSSIIYLAAILGINSDQYESAIVDGASRFQRMIYITLPSLVETILVVLLLKIKDILDVFTQVFVMYNPNVAEVSETLGTYTYMMGIQKGDFSFSTAAGLFNGLISLILVLSVNQIVKRLRGSAIV
ncbi:ABC transporter permease [Paenibacillus cymbidii]|uniref:ABC transporter permease n=1 Tax=Paenibacillus cymbidii TaxID=1639034 RepID=UPI0010819D53|nr:ABC transporter permease subunit [Paenibacillus cymbidii]